MIARATGLIFLIQSKWVQGVVCYDWNLQKHKYLSGISMVLHKTFRTGLVFPSQLKWVQGVVCYDPNLQKCKYLSGISTVLHETFRTGLVFLSQSKWVQGVVCYDGNLWKHKYLSRISTVLHETFRTGLVFLSWLKWVQGVVCYDRNIWKHKYLNGDEFPITFKVNYISEDLLPVMVTSHLLKCVLWYKLNCVCLLPGGRRWTDFLSVLHDLTLQVNLFSGNVIYWLPQFTQKHNGMFISILSDRCDRFKCKC